MQAPATFHNDFEVGRRLKLIETATLPELNQIVDALHTCDSVIRPIPLWQEQQRSYHQAVVERNLKLIKPSFFSRQ